jgi:hypothetical protein
VCSRRQMEGVLRFEAKGDPDVRFGHPRFLEGLP